MQDFYSKLWTVDFAVGLFANSLFWILDLVLIVLLLPAILSYLERRKWSSARYAASLLVSDLLMKSANQIAIYLDALDDLDPSLYRNPDEANTNLVTELQNHLERISLEFYNQFPIVSNSVNPDMSIQIAAIIKYNERLVHYGRSLAGVTDRIHARGTFVGAQRAAPTILQEFMDNVGKDVQRSAIRNHLIKLFDGQHRQEAHEISESVDKQVERIAESANVIALRVEEADRLKGTRTY